MTISCIYNENIISNHHIKHHKQFRETKNGNRLPIFRDNKAIIFIGENDRYRVQTFDGEDVYIGCGGIDEALGRIDYTQPFTNVQIIEGDRKYSRDEYYRHIAPVVWLIAQFYDDATGRLAISYERHKNGILLEDGTVIFTVHEEFADWLADKLNAEERPPAVRFGDCVAPVVLDRLTTIELNTDFTAEVKRGTWPRLRKKAQEQMPNQEIRTINGRLNKQSV